MKRNIDNKKRLTQRQFEILQFLVSFVLAHNYQPNTAMIAGAFGVSTAAIYQHLVLIQRKHWIELQPGQSRAVDIAPEAMELIQGKIPKKDWVKS